MTLRERQDQFIDNLLFFDNWTDRFNYLISLSEELPTECNPFLQKYKIDFCKSNTCFLPRMHEGLLYITGWSNSPVIGGIVVAMTTVFNFTSREEFKSTEIDFHTKSGLFENLTSLRRAGLEEMIRRISVLLSQNINN